MGGLHEEHPRMRLEKLAAHIHTR